MSPFKDISFGVIREIDDVRFLDVRYDNSKATIIGQGKRDRLFRAQPVLLLADSSSVAFIPKRDIHPEDSRPGESKPRKTNVSIILELWCCISISCIEANVMQGNAGKFCCQWKRRLNRSAVALPSCVDLAVILTLVLFEMTLRQDTR